MIKYIFFSFWIVLIYPLGVDLYLTGIPLIADELKATENQLHIAFSIYLAGMASTMLAAGWCADHIGRKPVVLVGAIIFAAASCAAAMASTINVFLFTRFLQGIGAGFCYVVTFALLRDVLNERLRTKVLAAMNGVTCIAPVLAPLIGFIILSFFHWSAMFYFMAGYALVSVIYCLAAIKETKPEITNEELSHGVVNHERVLNSYFIARLIISCLAMAVILTYVNVTPIILMKDLGFTIGEYSLSVTLLAMTSMITSFLMPKIISLVDSKTIMMTALTLFTCNAALLLLSMTYINTPVLLYVVFACCGIAFSMLFGIVMSQALSPFRRRAGVASSILAISQLGFASFYIWIMGWMGVPSSNMLFIILLVTGVTGITLLRFPALSPARASVNE